MKIVSIKVKAGCFFNHPKDKNQSRFTPELTLIASVGPNDDVDHEIGVLQKKAHEHIERYKQNVLRVIGENP